MKKMILALLLIPLTVSAQSLRMNSILTVDKDLLYDIEPANCYITGEVEYMFVPPYGMTLTIENIICGDKIFSNGFD